MWNAMQKVWVLDFATEYNVDREEGRISGAQAVRLDGAGKFSIDGDDVTTALFDAFNNRRAGMVFVWDIAFFGMFCDYWALKRALPLYKDAGRVKGRTRLPSEECYLALYAAGHGLLDFRLWMRRKGYAHINRHGSTGGIHCVEYRGLQAFFAGDTFDNVAREVAPSADRLEALRLVTIAMFDKLTELVGEDASQAKYLRSVYTVGGAARRAYLGIRYGTGAKLGAYHREHMAFEDTEDYFRKLRLQLGGMCFFPDANRGVLVEKPVYKYDVNGLYSDTANRCGELSFPMESTFSEFMKDRNPDHVYIVVMKEFVAFRKKGMPNVFMDPFGHSDGRGDVLDIPQEMAMFGELWRELHKFYDFEEYDIVRVLRCDRTDDPAIVKYNERFAAVKEEAGRRGDVVLRRMAKNFLNVLVGKFTQNSRYYNTEGVYNAERDCVEFTRGEFVDNWEKGHFDYIRGAYIYVMARVRVMQDIRKALSIDGDASLHHYYTDTDSIVTDVALPAEMVDPFRLGAYKLEATYTAFGVVAKKVYYGRLEDGTDTVTAAGMPRGLVAAEIRDAYGDALTPSEYWSIITSGVQYPVTCAMRCKGGGAMVIVPSRVCDVDVDELLKDGFYV